MIKDDQSLSTGTVADILLVEDDSADAELTLDALRRCGLADRVEHVSDGTDALDYITATNIFSAKHRPVTIKLILLDLKLQNVSGLHVLRQLKSDERTRGIPIVVLTSSRLAMELMESYKLGVNSYVIKPTSAGEFAKVVATIANYWLVINEPTPL